MLHSASRKLPKDLTQTLLALSQGLVRTKPLTNHALKPYRKVDAPLTYSYFDHNQVKAIIALLQTFCSGWTVLFVTAVLTMFYAVTGIVNGNTLRAHQRLSIIFAFKLESGTSFSCKYGGNCKTCNHFTSINSDLKLCYFYGF